MNLTSPSITYLLLIIPSLFAFAVMAQGIVKIAQGDDSGKIITGFGIFFVVLIVSAYWFFIR